MTVAPNIGKPVSAPNKVMDRIDRKECLRLIAAGEMNFTQIALKVGCSRERVRQIAERDLGLFGIQENERRKGERFSKMLPSHPFVAEAQKRGLIVEIVMGCRKPLLRVVMVNGIRTCLLKVWQAPYIGHNYVIFKPPDTECDAGVWTVRSIGFLILPKEKFPSDMTTFAIEVRYPNMGAITKRHDYRDYLNAWDVFKERQ